MADDRGAGGAWLLYEPGDRRVVGASPSTARLSGLGRDELRGRPLDDLVGLPPGGAVDVLGRIAEAGRDGGVFRVGRPAVLRRRGQPPLPVTLAASRARAGRRPLGLLAIEPAGDDADEAGWGFERAVLERVFRLSGELCAVVGLDGCVVQASPAWEAVTGVRPERLRGLPLARWVDPADLARARRVLRRLGHEAAAGPVAFEGRVRHRDGGTRRLAWRTMVAGGLAYVVATETHPAAVLVGPGSAAGIVGGVGVSVIPIGTPPGVGGPVHVSPPGAHPGATAPASGHAHELHAHAAGAGGRGLPMPALSGPRLPARVLLADDSPENRRVMGLRLELAGAAVALAADGLSALEQARAARGGGQPFDLVLLDMEMPGLDGFETVRRLRDDGFVIPVVALSAHATPEDRADCLRFGCNGHVSKPIDWNHLLHLLARLLDGERGSNALRVS